MARIQRGQGDFNYINTEKINKNFMYKNLERSNCFNCNFSNSNFDYTSFRGAHFKSCNFFGCSFTGAEFVGSNLKNSNFKNAKFENTVFESAKIEGADFTGAKFKNTVFLGTEISSSKGIELDNPEIRFFESMPDLEMSGMLKKSIYEAMENKFVKDSRVLDTRDGGINTLNVMILLNSFTEDQIIEGLAYIITKIDRDFHTLSYIIKFLKKYYELV